MDKYEWQKHASGGWVAVGSRVTCNPSPTDTDEDWLVLDLDHSLSKWLDDDGWTYGGSLSNEDEFASYKRWDQNVICCFTIQEYNSFKLATNVCKDLNLLNKADRIMVFEAIMYGNDITSSRSTAF